MSDRVAKFMRIDDRRKFQTVDEAVQEANRIREKISREADKRNFAVQLLIVVSDTDLRAETRVRPHLHIMLYGSPAETISKIIVKSINDYQRKHGCERSATRHGCDAGYIQYIVNQQRKIRYFERDPEGVLSDLNLKAEVLKVDQNAFRKCSIKISGNAKKQKGYSHSPELPRNFCGDSRNSCGDSHKKLSEGIPARKKAEKKWHSTEYSLITRGEWLAKSADEKAKYYNSLHMKLSFFAYKMHLTVAKITDDFARDGYIYYDTIERKFMTSEQVFWEHIDFKLHEKEMREKIISL